MDLSSFDFEYLRPPFEAEFLNHNVDYIKSRTGNNIKRRIFYNVSFETEELTAIQELEDYLQSQGVTLPIEWNASETLKFLYAENFNLEASAQMITDCLEWRADPRTSIIDDRVLQYFEAGVIYLSGLDKQFRPIIIINLNKLRQVKIDEDTFKVSLVIMFDILRTYCFLPRKIENWIVIVDAQGVKTIDPENIKSIIYLVRCCFPSTMEKLFVITASNFKDSHSSLIQSVGDKKSLEDVELISTGGLSKLQAVISPEHLEKKYGGEGPDIVKFWPPPKRNDTYQRTSITSLKHYSEAGTLDGLSKGGISSNRGNQEITSSEVGKPYTFAESQAPGSHQTLQSDGNRFQPNQMGQSQLQAQYSKFQGHSFNENFYKNQENLAESVLSAKGLLQSGKKGRSEEVNRNTSPLHSSYKSNSPSSHNYWASNPFQINKEGYDGDDQSVRSYASSQNKRNMKIIEERSLMENVEVPKSKARSPEKEETVNYYRQPYNQPNEGPNDYNSRETSTLQQRFKEDDSSMYRKSTTMMESKPLGEVMNRMNTGYERKTSDLSFQKDYMSGYDTSFKISQYKTDPLRTLEETSEGTPSKLLYSREQKDQIKKRLVEISGKKDEDSDEEEVKSNKRGLFCGCCVDKKKKPTRPKSKERRSKYAAW